MDRSLSLTAQVMSGKLGLDVVVEINVIIPEGTTTSILCMISLLNMQYLLPLIYDSTLLQMNQILSLVVVNFSPLVRP